MRGCEFIAAGKGNDAEGGGEGLGATGDYCREFALQGLCVDAAFAGDNEGGALKMMLEAEDVEDGVGTRLQLAAEDSPEGSGHAAGGAAAWLREHVPAHDGPVLLRQRPQPVVEHGDLLRFYALLRAVDGGGAFRSAEGGSHIAETCKTAFRP